MDWTENDEINNDRCSTASSVSNPGEFSNTSTSTMTMPAHTVSQKGSKIFATNGNTPKGTTKLLLNENGSNNQDSMSDGDLSDFSLNDTDDDEFRSNGNAGDQF